MKSSDIENITIQNDKNFSHSRLEFEAVRDKMKPVAIREYTETEAMEEQKSAHCLKSSTFSVQFWTIKECFRMIWEQEERLNFTYTWVVRTRPDVMVISGARKQIVKEVLHISSPGAKVAWRHPTGGGSDLLMIMTRAAAVPLGSVHESLFKEDDCGFGIAALPSALETNSTLNVKTFCKAAFPKDSALATRPQPVCLAYLAWKRSGVRVVFDQHIRGSVVRP